MTDMSPEEVVEEILGVKIEDRPAQAEPCWEEKHGPAVSSYDPDSFEAVTPFQRHIIERLTRIENGINQVGHQTSWLIQFASTAQEAFMQMSAEFSKAGPMGLIKMLTGKRSKGDDNG